jgi:hypothetical protein
VRQALIIILLISLQKSMDKIDEKVAGVVASNAGIDGAQAGGVACGDVFRWF